jgi:hypothetical protein
MQLPEKYKENFIRAKAPTWLTLPAFARNVEVLLVFFS